MATLVLVHGAFHGGWIWARVASRLRAEGHAVIAPTLTGCGDRAHLVTRELGLADHVRDLVATLEHEDVRDAIVVAHSYGGTVATAAVAQAPGRVRALIYLDAQAPVDGQSASGAMGEATGDRLSVLAGDAWLLPPLPLVATGLVAADDVAWVEPRRHPHPMRTLLEPVRAPEAAFTGIARRYVVCGRRQGLIDVFGVDPLVGFVDRARAAGWPVATIDAPHDAMVTHPALVAAAVTADA